MEHIGSPSGRRRDTAESVDIDGVARLVYLFKGGLGLLGLLEVRRGIYLVLVLFVVGGAASVVDGAAVVPVGFACFYACLVVLA